MKHFDPSRAWDYHVTSSGLDDLENTNTSLEYWDDESQHASYVGCSYHRLEEWGFTLVYSYDRETKLRLKTECVVTCEYLRDTF